MTLQTKNSENVSLLETYFLRTDSPALALQGAVNFAQALPGIAGLWTAGVGDSTTRPDLSAGGNDLVNNNNATVHQDGLYLPGSYQYDGVNQYHSYYSATGSLNITGTDIHVDSSIRGLTLFAWFKFTNNLVQSHIIGRRITAMANASSSYSLEKDNLNRLLFSVASGAVAVSTPIIQLTTLDDWFFIAGRYDPSTEIKCWLGDNGELSTTTNVAAIPASINNPVTPFTIGASASPGIFLQGNVSICGVYATTLSDANVELLFHLTRRAYAK